MANAIPNRQLVAIGGPVTSIVANADTEVTFDIKQGGVLAKLIVALDDLGQNITISSIIHNNDSLSTGNLPTPLFAADSMTSPIFGTVVKASQNLVVTFTNPSANAVTATTAFTVA